MIMDLHNHTYYSYDGTDSPEAVIENAIRSGVEVIGITDHQFSLGGRLEEYKSRLLSCKKEYSPYINVLAGLEIGTRPAPDDWKTGDEKGLDYVLFESLDSVRAMDFREFLAWRHTFTCPVGLAHCDIFAMGERYGINMLDVMREEKIFWEINTSGNYIYYYDFLTNAKKRNDVLAAGVGVSIGSDTHAVSEYRKKQLVRANEIAMSVGLKLPFRL